MMNQTQKERLDQLQRYTGKISDNTFMQNWYNTFADSYVDNLIKEVKCDMNKGLMLSDLLEQLKQLHIKSEIKDELKYCSVGLLGFTEEEEIINFMQEEKEYMQIVEEEFEEIYQETIADQEYLMGRFTEELQERVAHALFTDKEREEISNSIKSIIARGELSSYKPETKFPMTINEWCFLIPNEDIDIETTAKLMQQTDAVFTAIRNLIYGYLNTDEAKELHNYQICNIEHSASTEGSEWIHLIAACI